MWVVGNLVEVGVEAVGVLYFEIGRYVLVIVGELCHPVFAVGVGKGVEGGGGDGLAVEGGGV